MLPYKLNGTDWSGTAVISQYSVPMYLTEISSPLPLNFITAWVGLVSLYSSFQHLLPWIYILGVLGKRVGGCKHVYCVYCFPHSEDPSEDVRFRSLDDAREIGKKNERKGERKEGENFIVLLNIRTDF